MVYFRGSDVLATGDIFHPGPLSDHRSAIAAAASRAMIDALNRILDIAVPEFRLEGGTMVIPGHGRLCDAADVAYYRDMADHHSRPHSGHDQEGHDARAGEGRQAHPGLRRHLRRDHGFWTTDMFVEAVYKSSQPEEIRYPVMTNCGTALTVAIAADRAAGSESEAAGQAKAARPSISPATGYRSSPRTGAYRMMTPAKGDYPSIPLNAEGRKAGRRLGSGQGRSGGRSLQGLRRRKHHAHARTPAHHLAGRQHAEESKPTPACRRACSISAPPGAAGEAHWQGFSVAQWEFAGGGRGRGGQPGR